MSIFVWIVLGLTIGFVAAKVLGIRDRGLPASPVLGAFGAVAGGLVFQAFGDVSGSSIHLNGLVVAGICATLLVTIYYLVTPRRDAT